MYQNFVWLSTFDDVWNGFRYHTANESQEIVNRQLSSSIFQNAYLMQSIIGQTDRHRVHPVQSSVTWARCVFGSKSMAWYPESAHAI